MVAKSCGAKQSGGCPKGSTPFTTHLFSRKFVMIYLFVALIVFIIFLIYVCGHVFYHNSEYDMGEWGAGFLLAVAGSVLWPITIFVVSLCIFGPKFKKTIEANLKPFSIKVFIFFNKIMSID